MYLFIYWVVVWVEAYGIVSYSMWDLIPDQDLNPGTLQWECESSENTDY